ncbi:unnamed protein product [Chrysoparadoxa australica]
MAKRPDGMALPAPLVRRGSQSIPLLSPTRGEEPVLYRVFGRVLERVPFKKHGLTSKCCYLLLDSNKKEVYNWIGVRSSMKDRNHVERMANSIIANDLGEGWKSGMVIRESMVARSTSHEVTSFKSVLARAPDANDPPPAASGKDAPMPTMFPTNIHKVTIFDGEISWENVTAREPPPTEEGELDQHLLLFSCVADHPGCIFVVETMHECFVYASKDATDETVTRVHEHAKNTEKYDFVTAVEEGIESTLFKARFKSWEGMHSKELVRPPSPMSLARERLKLQEQEKASMIPAAARKSIYKRRPSAQATGRVLLPEPPQSPHSAAPPQRVPSLRTGLSYTSKSIPKRGVRTAWRPDKQGTGRVEQDTWLANDSFETDDGGTPVRAKEPPPGAEPLIPLAKNGIWAEVTRSMLSTKTGTVAMVTQGLGDPCDDRLLMEKALDPKALVEQWVVGLPEGKSAPPGLVLKQVRKSRVGVLTSGDAYIVVRHKAYVIVSADEELSTVESGVGVETVVYLWVGRDCQQRAKIREVVKGDTQGVFLHQALDVGAVSEHSIIKVMIDQGKEPPYFLGLLSRGGSNLGAVFLKGTINKKRRKSNPPADLGVRVFEVLETPQFPFMQSNCLLCLESDINTAAKGLHHHKSYIVLDRPNSKHCSFQGMWIWHGGEESEQIDCFINHLVRNNTILFLPGRKKRQPHNLMRGSAYHLKPDQNVPNEFWEVLGVDIENPPPECSDVPALRATRLWLIDYVKAKEYSLNVRVGDSSQKAHWGPYVKEIGPLGMFTQSDLDQDTSFILDGGGGHLFVWHGAKSSKKARNLALRVGKVYCASTLVGVNLPANWTVMLHQVESGEEPITFLSSFRGWRVRKQPRRSKRVPGQDPYKLDEDDYQDVKDAEDAMLKVQAHKPTIKRRASLTKKNSMQSNTNGDPPTKGDVRGGGSQHLRRESSRRAAHHVSRSSGSTSTSATGEAQGTSRGPSPMGARPQEPESLRQLPLKQKEGAGADDEASIGTRLHRGSDIASPRLMLQVQLQQEQDADELESLNPTLTYPTVSAEVEVSTSSPEKLEVKAKNEETGVTWSVARAPVDFTSLQGLLQADCSDATAKLPADSSDLAAFATAAQAWLAELLGRPNLSNQSRLRLLAFLGSDDLSSLLAAVHRDYQQFNDGKVYETAMKEESAPTEGIFHGLKRKLVDASKANMGAGQVLPLEFKLKQARTRENFASTQEEDERRKITIGKRACDKLHRERKDLRQKVYDEMIKLQAAESSGTPAKPSKSSFSNRAIPPGTPVSRAQAAVMRRQGKMNAVNASPKPGKGTNMTPEDGKRKGRSLLSKLTRKGKKDDEGSTPAKPPKPAAHLAINSEIDPSDLTEVEGFASPFAAAKEHHTKLLMATGTSPTRKRVSPGAGSAGGIVGELRAQLTQVESLYNSRKKDYKAHVDKAAEISQERQLANLRVIGLEKDVAKAMNMVHAQLDDYLVQQALKERGITDDV